MEILKKGKVGEQVFKEYLINVKKEQILNICNYWQYDFLTNLNKYEIKTDYYFNDLNSFYIEFMSMGHNSGINATEADIFVVIGVCHEYYKIIEIETNKLKELILNKEFKIKISNCINYKGFKNGFNKGYIIPFDDLDKIALNIYNFNK